MRYPVLLASTHIITGGWAGHRKATKPDAGPLQHGCEGDTRSPDGLPNQECSVRRSAYSRQDLAQA